MTTGKTIALTRQTFVGKVTSLLLNMLSRLVITFLPRSKRLLISWLQSPSAVILELPLKKVCHCFHCFPIYFPWSYGTRCHDLSFLNWLHLKPPQKTANITNGCILRQCYTAEGSLCSSTFSSSYLMWLWKNLNSFLNLSFYFHEMTEFHQEQAKK